MAKGMSKDTKNIVGSVAYAVAGEPLIDTVMSKVFGVQKADEFLKGIAGYIISKNSKGVVKAVGDSAVSIAAYKVGGQRLGNVLGGLVGGTKSVDQGNNNGVVIA